MLRNLRHAFWLFLAKRQRLLSWEQRMYCLRRAIRLTYPTARRNGGE